jgi:hypothetical protein
MHRKMKSEYKDLIEILQEKIFLVETYKYEEEKSKTVHEGVRETEVWLHSFLTSALLRSRLGELYSRFARSGVEIKISCP